MRWGRTSSASDWTSVERRGHLGRRDEAMAEFKKASELDPKGAPAALPKKRLPNGKPSATGTPIGHKSCRPCEKSY
jgi:hypothetical protein